MPTLAMDYADETMPLAAGISDELHETANRICLTQSVQVQLCRSGTTEPT